MSLLRHEISFAISPTLSMPHDISLLRFSLLPPPIDIITRIPAAPRRVNNVNTVICSPALADAYCCSPYATLIFHY